MLPVVVKIFKLLDNNVMCSGWQMMLIIVNDLMLTSSASVITSVKEHATEASVLSAHKLRTFTMPIEKMLCPTLLVATQFNGGSAQPRLNRRQLGGVVVCTEELCRERFTTLSRARTLMGYFYSNIDIPTKGCFVKGDSMYYGTGGTDSEMNDSDLGVAKKRVWCDAITLNEE